MPFAVNAREINITGTVDKLVYIAPDYGKYPEFAKYAYFKIIPNSENLGEDVIDFKRSNVCNSYVIFDTTSGEHNMTISMLLAAKMAGADITASLKTELLFGGKCKLLWLRME